MVAIEKRLDPFGDGLLFAALAGFVSVEKSVRKTQQNEEGMSQRAVLVVNKRTVTIQFEIYN